MGGASRDMGGATAARLAGECRWREKEPTGVEKINRDDDPSFRGPEILVGDPAGDG